MTDVVSNIVAFRPRQRPDPTTNVLSLLEAVATARRHPDDVFWLKENAELLNVLAATGTKLPVGALAPYDAFYDAIEEKLRFFPQYYRFFLSICLDLEDLGLDGAKGRGLCKWVAAVGLAEAEISDLQRAEAQRLLSRRGAASALMDDPLAARLHRFLDRPQTFALPNKKAAYELTHIVFYLSEYGQRDPGLSAAALRSLENTGLIAYLDQNHDLLAEVCTSLRYAGGTPNAVWTEAVAAAHAGIVPSQLGDAGPGSDAFHAYIVTAWAEAEARGMPFQAEVPDGAVTFVDQNRPNGALRALSSCLFDLGDARRADWPAMRGSVIAALDGESRRILEAAEASSERFGEFFAGFARASNF